MRINILKIIIHKYVKLYPFACRKTIAFLFAVSKKDVSKHKSQLTSFDLFLFALNSEQSI